MSWSDDIRCLYCDGKLALYRKLTNGQFCSAAHRKAYWQEQEKLALERLHQTRDSLQTQRRPDATAAKLATPVPNPFFVESQFPTPAEQAVRVNPENEAFARSASNTDRVVTAGFLIDSALVPVDWVALLSLKEPEPVSWATLTPSIPHQLSDRLVRNFSMADFVEMPRNVRGIALPPPSPTPLDASTPDVWIPVTVSTEAHSENLPHGNPVQLAHLVSGSLRVIPAAFSAGVSPVLSVPRASMTALLHAARPETPELQISHSEAADLPIFEPETTPVEPALTAAEIQAEVSSDVVIVEEMFAAEAPIVAAVDMAAVEETPVEVPSVEASQTEEPTVDVPAMAAAVPLASVDAKEIPFRVTAAPSELSIAAGAPSLPLSLTNGAELNPGMAHLVALPVQQAASGTPFIALSTDALDPVAHRQPAEIRTLGIPKSACAPEPRFAPGARYVIELSAGAIRSQAEEKPLSNKQSPVLVRLPEDVRVAVEPGEASVVPLPFRPAALVPGDFHMTIPQLELAAPSEQTPMLVRAKLQPADGEIAPMPKRKLFGMEIWTPVSSGDPKHAWSHAADFWQNAPRDLKLLVIAIPVLLGLALHPSLPKVRVTAPTASSRDIEQIKGGFGNSLSRQFQVVRRTVAERAAVALNEDFRSGLDDWQARGDLSSGWSFDRNGFVKPGALAFYRPSMHLTDYDAEFLGLIDQRALSFVARAKDFDNYYVIKINIVKPGPVPTIGVTRYAVIDGKPQDRVDTIAPITARPDMLYRVGLSVQGDSFLLTLQGQVTDSWSEPKLSRGGIGFFAARGEESRLRWVQITHQYDMLGRLCAFLAPQNIPNTNGSW